jgi:hypothetical protein
MQIQSELHIGSHPDRDESAGHSFTNGEPHAMGLLKVPTADINSHPRLQEIYNALPAGAQEFVQREGNLALSHDFTFEEDYKAGVGLIVKDLSLDVSRLKEPEKAQIADWMQQQYGVSATGDSELQQATQSLKMHITTDMTLAGMSQEYLSQLITEHRDGVPHDDRETSLVPAEDAANIVQSLQSRLGLSDTPDLSPGSADSEKLSAHYQRTQSMRDYWPNASSENYGREEPGQGEVIFFKGFEAHGAEYIKAGPYAYSCAWPTNAEFDRNGIPRDEEGNILSPKAVESDPDYVYPPNSVIAREFSGQEASAIVDNFFAANTSIYDGFDKNCAGVSGRVVFGEAFNQIEERGRKNDKLWDPAHLQGMADQGRLPEGMHYHQVDVQGTDLSLDHNALHASTKAVEQQQTGQQQAREQDAQAAKTAPPAAKSFGSLPGMGDAIKALAQSGASMPASQTPSLPAIQRTQTSRGLG